MGILSKSNLNLNLNLGSVESLRGGGLAARPRFNTQEFRKLIDPALDVVPAAFAQKFSQNWDAELRSYVYLREFVERNASWFADTKAEALKNGRKPADKMTKSELQQAALEMLEAAPEREERFAEIIDQNDADGAINYWLGMLMIDPARHPSTYLLVRVARRVGEMVVMCLKDDFLAPRPSQICPAIVPMIDPPATPSFPAGHALQAYLISYCLYNALPKIPQSTPPTSPTDPRIGLFALAQRVTENRLIAGLHFRVDNEAGEAAGKLCADKLKGGTLYDGLVIKAQNEFPQYK